MYVLVHLYGTYLPLIHLNFFSAFAVLFLLYLGLLPIDKHNRFILIQRALGLCDSSSSSRPLEERSTFGQHIVFFYHRAQKLSFWVEDPLN